MQWSPSADISETDEEYLICADAADHRVTDGRAGSRLLRRIADLLCHPETL